VAFLNSSLLCLQIMWLVDIFRAKIVDISENLVTVEVSIFPYAYGMQLVSSLIFPELH